MIDGAYIYLQKQNKNTSSPRFYTIYIFNSHGFWCFFSFFQKIDSEPLECEVSTRKGRIPNYVNLCYNNCGCVEVHKKDGCYMEVRKVKIEDDNRVLRTLMWAKKSSKSNNPQQALIQASAETLICLGDFSCFPS